MPYNSIFPYFPYPAIFYLHIFSILHCISVDQLLCLEIILMAFSHLCRLCGKSVEITEAFAKSIQRTGGSSIICSTCLAHQTTHLLPSRPSARLSFVRLITKTFFIVTFLFILTSFFSAWRILYGLEMWMEPSKSNPAQSTN